MTITNWCLLLLLIIVWTLSSLTFNMYYPYSHLDSSHFNFTFYIVQIVKISAMLILPLAIYLDHKPSKTIAKFILPIFALLSIVAFPEYIKMNKLDTLNYPTEPVDPNYALSITETEIFDKVNLFMPTWLIGTLFFLEIILICAISGILWYTDDFKKQDLRYLYYFPLYVVVTLPLNLMDTAVRNMSYGALDFFYFRNWGAWHFCLFAMLILVSIIAYLSLRKLSREKQDFYLIAMAIVLVIHYQSRTSMLIGEGYNTYNTVFAAVPLFICDIGKYLVLIALILKKDTLYKICYYVHGGGALSVFFYFGAEGVNNYGTIFSYTFLYYTITHTLLFLCCSLPKWLGHFEFKFKDALLPTAYLFICLLASVLAGAAVTNHMARLVDSSGEHLPYLFIPNYSFAQVCPINITFPKSFDIKIGLYNANFIYFICLGGVYSAIFLIWYSMQLSYQKTKEALINHFKTT